MPFTSFAPRDSSSSQEPVDLFIPKMENYSNFRMLHPGKEVSCRIVGINGDSPFIGSDQLEFWKNRFDSGRDTRKQRDLAGGGMEMGTYPRVKDRISSVVIFSVVFPRIRLIKRRPRFNEDPAFFMITVFPVTSNFTSVPGRRPASSLILRGMVT